MLNPLYGWSSKGTLSLEATVEESDEDDFVDVMMSCLQTRTQCRREILLIENRERVRKKYHRRCSFSKVQ